MAQKIHLLPRRPGFIYSAIIPQCYVTLMQGHHLELCLLDTPKPLCLPKRGALVCLCGPCLKEGSKFALDANKQAKLG